MVQHKISRSKIKKIQNFEKGHILIENSVKPAVNPEALKDNQKIDDKFKFKIAECLPMFRICVLDTKQNRTNRK